MKKIAITLPTFHPREAQDICRLLRSDFHSVHLRKPQCSTHEMESLIKDIPTALRANIVLHEHFALATKYNLGGIHLNRRHPNPPPHPFHGTISTSCHTLEEVKAKKAHHAYLFLSPIFDSISKPNYPSAFTPQQLQAAAQSGIIDRQVIALGGITPECLPTLEQWGFGGAAMMGSAWR